MRNFTLIDKVNAWPKKATQENTFFDQFRTIDAATLPQVYNTVCGKPLEEKFIAIIENIRRRRNAIVHAASDKAIPTCKAITLDVLEVSSNLVGKGKWPSLHRAQAISSPFSSIDHHNQIEAGLVSDFAFLLHLLKPSETIKYLGLSKKQRRYYCPTCKHGDCAPDIKSALLRPNKPDSTTLYCIACDYHHVVIRKKCLECIGNVIDEEFTCLTCGEHSGHDA